MEKELETVSRRAAITEGNALALAVMIYSLAAVLPKPQQQEFLQKATSQLEHLEAGMLAEDGPYSEYSLRGMRNVRAMLDGLHAEG